MKITLTQPEIEQAVREFVGKGISLNNASAMTVEFSMGRGDNGLTAAIDVPYMGVASLPVTKLADTAIPATTVTGTGVTTALAVDPPPAASPGFVSDVAQEGRVEDAPAPAAAGKSLFGNATS